MTYISVKNKTLIPYINVKIGDEVVYQNRNGEYYKGKILSDEEWHSPEFIMTERKFGIKVDFDDIVLILNKPELFILINGSDMMQKRMENKDLEFTIRNILGLHLNNFYQENGLSVSCKTRTQVEDKIIKELFDTINNLVKHNKANSLYLKEWAEKYNALESDYENAINIIETEFSDEELNNPYTDLGKFYINYKKTSD